MGLCRLKGIIDHDHCINSLLWGQITMLWMENVSKRKQTNCLTYLIHCITYNEWINDHLVKCMLFNFQTSYRIVLGLDVSTDERLCGSAHSGRGCLAEFPTVDQGRHVLDTDLHHKCGGSCHPVQCLVSHSPTSGRSDLEGNPWTRSHHHLIWNDTILFDEQIGTIGNLILRTHI